MLVPFCHCNKNLTKPALKVRFMSVHGLRVFSPSQLHLLERLVEHHGAHGEAAHFTVATKQTRQRDAGNKTHPTEHRFSQSVPTFYTSCRLPKPIKLRINQWVNPPMTSELLKSNLPKKPRMIVVCIPVSPSWGGGIKLRISLLTT